jgi:hypothetical protein
MPANSGGEAYMAARLTRWDNHTNQEKSGRRDYRKRRFRDILETFYCRVKHYLAETQQKACKPCFKKDDSRRFGCVL